MLVHIQIMHQHRRRTSDKPDSRFMLSFGKKIRSGLLKGCTVCFVFFFDKTLFSFYESVNRYYKLMVSIGRFFACIADPDRVNRCHCKKLYVIPASTTLSALWRFRKDRSIGWKRRS